MESGSMQMGEMVAHAVLENSVKPLLPAGEELVDSLGVRKMTRFKKVFVACLDVNPVGEDLRLLVMAVRRGVVDEEKGIVIETPVEQVQSVAYRGGMNAGTVSWNAGGRQYELSLDSRVAKRIASSLQTAGAQGVNSDQ